MISATVWSTRSGDLGSAMQRASRSAMPSRRSISASTSTPASEVRRPPSKAARTALPATGDEKALRSCRSTTRSTAVRDRLHPSRRARPLGETRMDVGAWLHGLGLGQYEQAFRDNDVDADLLARLTAEDLKEIGVASVGHRRRLLDAIATLRAETVQRSPPAAGSMSDAPTSEPSGAEAERRQLTVMFVDLVGSTVLSTRLDPEELRQVLRTYQDAVAGAVARFEGHVAKFLGDGVLAYFGWPRAHEDDAERAVRAGLAAVDGVDRLRAPGDEPIAARVGIATGLVVVGDLLGEGAAREEAVVGETPNLAARLQTLARPNEIVIAPSTRRLVGRLFELEALGPQMLKGLAATVAIYRVVGEGRAESRFEAQHGGRVAPLVGRGQELGLLLDRWRRARSGEGQVVLLAGEPGIGKSRLLEGLRGATRRG